MKGKTTRPGLYQCNACRKPFSVTVGTLYERSHIPLNKWLAATYLLMSSKKGMSALQIGRMIGVSKKTAWFLCHRIRESVKVVHGSEPPLGGDGFVVEADETYIGKKDGPKGRKHPGSGGAAHKRAVLSLVERGGQIRSFKLGSPTRAEIAPLVRDNVDPASTLHTDGSNLYRGMAFTADHESVDHNKTYVRQGKSEKVHTNTLEGFFSVFKRGMVGTYQHCGEQHLHRYLAEFDFRYNYREAVGYEDLERFSQSIPGIVGRRLTYRCTIEQ